MRVSHFYKIHSLHRFTNIHVTKLSHFERSKWNDEDPIKQLILVLLLHDCDVCPQHCTSKDDSDSHNNSSLHTIFRSGFVVRPRDNIFSVTFSLRLWFYRLNRSTNFIAWHKLHSKCEKYGRLLLHKLAGLPHAP